MKVANAWLALLSVAAIASLGLAGAGARAETVPPLAVEAMYEGCISRQSSTTMTELCRCVADEVGTRMTLAEFLAMGDSATGQGIEGYTAADLESANEKILEIFADCTAEMSN